VVSLLLLDIFSQLQFLHMNDFCGLRDCPEALKVSSDIKPVYCRFKPPALTSTLRGRRT
jgi:hypothetical protein